MSELSQLVKSRGRIKAKLITFGTFLNSLETNQSKRVELASRIEKVEELWSEFDKVQIEIEDVDESEDQLTARNIFEDSYHELISKARELLKGNQAIPPTNLQPGISQFLLLDPLAIRPVVKLPNIDIPKFDGNYER